MTKRLLVGLGTVLLTLALAGIASAVVGQTDTQPDDASTMEDITTADDDSSFDDKDDDVSDSVDDESSDSFDDTDDEKAFIGVNHIQRDRLKVDTLKFVLGKLRARKWGDKLDVTSDGKKLESVNVTVVMPGQNPDDIDAPIGN